MQKFWNWLLGIEHDFEAIISNLANTVSALEARAEKRVIDAAKHAEEALRHTSLEDAALTEAEKAKYAATNLKGLFT